MTSETYSRPGATRDRALRRNKVPEVTLYFWVIKILCTTAGETAADFLNAHMGLGLTGTSIVMSALLVLALVIQFRVTAYRPSVYWLVVVLVSVVGTLISDNLTDNLGVALEATTTVFAVALGLVFLAWYRTERTLSIRSIDTMRREAFYWAAVLFTFALGTAAGDLVAEQLPLGYSLSAAVFALAIGAVWLAHAIGLDAVWGFWTAYVLTRPLGASLGDYLSQTPDDGGLGLGTVVTSALFLVVILVLVVFLTLTRKDAADRDGFSRPAA
ncbi:hypothetical protein ACFXGI_03605 [Streptomyces sp. NPDC059355]|uniref:COG4705 family protein n=1 Tax=Streptomyces sp. NPDC059355 TaxID=3346811 RepID=UPI0036807E30